MQYGFYVNSSKCTGCKTCQVSCKDEKDNPLGINFIRVYEYGGGDWQHVDGLWKNNTFIYYMPIACSHCSNPTCLQSCPSGAIHKRPEDGLVMINSDLCTGCRVCETNCPYGALKFDEQKKVMTKCDGCASRLSEGKNPVCVDACPQFALAFSDIDLLREKQDNESSIAPLPDAAITKPNLVIKPHAQAKPSGDTLGKILNPEEV